MSTTLTEFHKKLLQQLQAAKVTVEDRKQHGIKSGTHKGKYPIANREQALSAIKERHSAKPKLTAQEVKTLLRRAAKYAPKEAAAARAKDKAA